MTKNGNLRQKRTILSWVQVPPEEIKEEENDNLAKSK